MRVQLSHQIRIDPTPAQEAYFRRACGVARFTYNWALAQWKEQYAAGQKPSAYALKKQFNSIRHEQFPWTGEVHRDCTSQAFTNVGKAFNNFFKRHGKSPKFKKKGQSRDSFYLANDQFWVEGQTAKLPLVGKVKLREPLRFTGKVMSGTVSRVADQWHLSVAVDVGDSYSKHPSEERRPVVGVDLGIKHLAVLSTGEKIEGPKALVKALDKLGRLQRGVSRKQKGSANRKKAAARVARQHLKVSNTRKDFAHKLTSRLVHENQVVVVEDLNVKGMGKLFGRQVADQGFAEIRRQLTYKAPIYGAQIVVADRWFPSSKLCSSCGKIKQDLKLSEREYCCDYCGAVEDRDINAAMNLEQLGWATAEVTPVDMEALASDCLRSDVKLPWTKQEVSTAVGDHGAVEVQQRNLPGPACFW